MMKRLSDLTKQQRSEWIAENGVRKLGKLMEAETSVKYIIDNNSKEDIAEWLKSATTTYFDSSCAPYYCSVFEFNKLTEYLKEV